MIFNISVCIYIDVKVIKHLFKEASFLLLGLLLSLLALLALLCLLFLRDSNKAFSHHTASPPGLQLQGQRSQIIV